MTVFVTVKVTVTMTVTMTAAVRMGWVLGERKGKEAREGKRIGRIG